MVTSKRSVDKRSLSVGELLETQVEAFGDQEFLYDLQTRLTYKEFNQEVNKLVTGLQNLGVKKGDKIGVCLPNWYENVMIFFASAKIGAILVPFNPMYRSKEIEYILKNSEPKVLFIKDTFSTNVGIDLAASIVDTIISVRFDQDDLLSFQQLVDNATPTDPVIPSLNVDEDLYCILYTSGTTGLPKGVMTTHRSVVHSANTLVQEMKITEQDVFVTPAPIFHIFGIVCNLMAALASGGRMILMERFHPQKILELIEQEKVTVHQGVPTMFLKELEQGNPENYDLSTLRVGVTGGAPITSSQMKRVREELGFNLLQSFGTSETGSLTLSDDKGEEQAILESLGKPIDGVKVKIVDQSRTPVPIGFVGEIAVHSVGNMKGYYKLPEETAKVLDEDGFYYTGDLGKLDDQLNLYFVGREKELIIRGGFNIYPQEIETVLKLHQAVSEVAVFGEPDQVLGEISIAAVKLVEGATLTEEEMKNFIAEHLAKYKVPSRIIFVDEFPVTASGKIQKAALKKQLDKQA
ncbi:class I adenylate-forming enzyme family protein [Aquibacillus sediminis]|uniref:class I adenylate-forming enzyme family protein n=1 Tax=Aquibacillus sediminis TaxID=2574734 RepID=UPI001108643B|nr:class I adenylate-forming enzyme family protein [Aquibacillus sediminis]